MSAAPRKKIHFFNRGLTLPEGSRADEGPIPELVPLSQEVSRSHEDLRDCANLSPQTPKCSLDFNPDDFSGATQQDQPVLWETESFEENHNSEYERTRKTRIKSDLSLFNSQEHDTSDRVHTTQNMINFSVEKILSSELCKGVDNRKDDIYVKNRGVDTGRGSVINDNTQDKTDPQFDETFHGILARRLISGSASKVPCGSSSGTDKSRTDEVGFGVLSPQLLNGVGRNSVMSAFSCVGRLAVVGLRTHPLARTQFELPMDGETNPPPKIPAKGNSSGTTNVEIPQGNNSDGSQKESFVPEASLSHRKKRRCRLCMNHNIDVDMKGHKHRCTYLNCPCDACTITRKGRLYMKKQLALTRFQQQSLLHNARKAESVNEGDHSNAREKQPYPGIGELERETKDVIDFSLLEKINSKYPNL